MMPFIGSRQQLNQTMGINNSEFNILPVPHPVSIQSSQQQYIEQLPPQQMNPASTPCNNPLNQTQYQMEQDIMSVVPETYHGLPGAYMNGQSVGYNSSSSTSVGYFIQPHMSQMNMGTSGFPSPSLAIPNRTIPQISNHSRIPFLGTASTTVYQFPSPIYSQPIQEQPRTTMISNIRCSQQSMTPSEVKSGLPSVPAGSTWNPNAWNQNGANMFTIGASVRGTSKSPKSESYTRSRIHSKRRPRYPEDDKETRACRSTVVPYVTTEKRNNSRPTFPTKPSMNGMNEAGSKNSRLEPPQKIFINEARMSERLQELNLDNNNMAWHPDLEERPWFARRALSPGNNNNSTTPDSGIQIFNNGDGSDDDISDLEDCADVPSRDSPQAKNMPRLEILQDLKKVKPKEILPKSILQELAKPTMQIVLWKPPGDFVKNVLPPRDDLVNEISSSQISPGDTTRQQTIKSGDDMDIEPMCANTPCPDMGFIFPVSPAIPPDVFPSTPTDVKDLLLPTMDDDDMDL